MGLMGLLFKVAVECFNILAWPLFALGYPLCASVQAIETNSTSDALKLITYWVCFSVILLFEHAFEKLLERLPYWPYIKLMIIGCLVTPHFDGSFYVYKHLLHPCLSMNPRIVFDWSIKLLELLKQDNLTEAKTQAKETEPEAKENLIAFEPKFEQLKDMQKVINAAEITEKNEVSATKQFRQIPSNFSLPGNTTCDLVEIKEMTAANSMGGGNPLGIPPLKKMQKEWSCAVCQVTTTSEADLNSHLQGNRHEEACEKLKAKNQSSKSKIPPSVETGRPQNKEIDRDHPDKEYSENVGVEQKAESPKSHYEAPASVEADGGLKNKQTGSASIAGGDISDEQHMNAQRPWICQLCQEICSSEIDFASHLLRKRHTDACEKLKAKDQPLKNNDSPILSWTCAVCKITTTSKIDLVSHFQGQRHAVALEKLKANPNSKDSFELWTCGICHVKIRSEKNLISHLQGRRHCDACEEYKTWRKTAKNEASSASFGNTSKEKSGVVEVRDNKWWCSICNISCTCEANMKKHLIGNQHSARTRELIGAAASGQT